MERFARTMYRRRRLVVAAWLVALVVVSVAARSWGGDHRVDYSMPGSESAEAQHLLAERFPELSGDAVQLLFNAPDGVDRPATAERITEVRAQATEVAHVKATEAVATSPDGTVLLVNVQLDATSEKVPTSSIEALMALADENDGPGLTVEAGGAAVQSVEGSEAGSEQFGMIAALVILLIAFGSLLAAGLPILVAVFGVGMALALVELMNRVLMIPDWAPQLVTMIGIGVGIDYALFIVTRYRGALAEGFEPEDAVVVAVTTAGRAVLFAGGTVVISLVGLCAMGLEYLYGTAAATVLGVLVVLVASMTLLPAVLGFAGHGIDRLRLPFVRGDRGEQGLWHRWSRVVQRRPLVTGTVALLALLAVAAPFGGLRFGYPDAGTGPEHLTSRRAYDLVASSFGVGANGPLVLAVDVEDDPAVVDRLSTAVADTEGVAAVLPARLNETGDTAALFVVPATGPQDRRTQDLIHRLRNDVVPEVAAASEADVYVGGANAAFVDESEFMAGRLPWFIGAVIALSFLLLLTVFRSVLVAVKAALMNLLAIGAAYGVMAVALQGGRLGGLLGIHEPTPVPAWTPMMMFALLFGLSMDYEVFLLSRIREEYLRTGDNASAVADGMARTGRVISAAAAIMVTVFGAFILGDQVLVKVIGLGLSTAVLLDATLVRMVLVPSTMELLGDRNWWLPGWLDRLLPRVDIEGRGHEAAPASRPAVIGPAVTGPVVTGVRVPVTETDVVVDLVRAEYGPASASPGRGDGELVGSR
jgi:RND superfamily putative drug exporter